MTYSTTYVNTILRQLISAAKSDYSLRKKMKILLKKFLLLLIVFSTAACASSPPNKFGHHHDYPYRAPDYVAVADEDECSRKANSEAFASISDMSNTPGLLFGAIGATIQLARANHTLNSTYEKAMKTCLKDKGYNLED